MVCIYCGGRTNVINSRAQKRSNSVWRRRQCDQCSAVFTSQEHADLSGGLRISLKQPEQLAPFSRETLFIHIYDCCKHRDTAITDASALTQTISNRILAITREGIITRETLIRTTTKTLLPFDKVAA